MTYITGDIHGDYFDFAHFYKFFKVKESDLVIILGDVGANYYKGKKDKTFKYQMNALGSEILCIHGNHEMRPANIPTYKQKEWHGGIVWYEEEYPHLLFAKDGEIYNIDNKKCIAIGGAYSVDKFYRLSRGYAWWEDEQPSEEIKEYVEKQLKENKIDYILSHTCPFKYEPVEAFLGCIDQSTVDNSTELWLDKIEESTDYKGWYCGHFHIDKNIDKMHFYFNLFEPFPHNTMFCETVDA